jgi:cytochrome oxidase assembly protein ShyY1
VSSIREHPAVTDDGKPRRRLAFLASRGWIGIILAVLAFSAACFFILAPWQFSRNAERTAQNNAVDASITAPAVPVAELMSTSAQPPGGVTWRVVTATGEFDATRQVQVRLRQDANGNPVSEVIAPFRMTSGQTLLVDRGYVSFTDVRNDVPIAALPTGEVTITGRVQDEQTDPSNRQPLVVGDHTEAYAINVAAIGGAEASEVFLQGYIQLTDSSPGVLTPIDLPQTDSGPFLSYALQWEAFGIIALIGLGVFIYREIADPRPPDDRDQPGDREQPDAPVASGSPVADAAVMAAPASSQRRRRSRDGFDRSQLYDD